ncbi:MAG: hypothetical protein VXZ96_12975 [Myxococcota bacterium]|nr:hypothetical protein [Myxococcota bacterium]MEC8381234.1 hypothetical protein [Myxococcota bacterium]
MTKVLALLSILCLGFFSTTAEAGKKATVKTIGVQSFDQVFRKAKQIDNKLTKAERQTKRARANFNDALGLKKKSTYQAGLAEIVQKAQGKVRMALQGGVPSLTIQEALPTRIKKGVDALNASCKANVNALKTVIELPADSQALIQRAQQLPQRFKNEVANNPVKILTSIREIRTIGSNIKVIKNMPARARNLIKHIKEDMKKIVNAFNFNWRFGG